MSFESRITEIPPRFDWGSRASSRNRTKYKGRYNIIIWCIAGALYSPYFYKWPLFVFVNSRAAAAQCIYANTALHQNPTRKSVDSYVRSTRTALHRAWWPKHIVITRWQYGIMIIVIDRNYFYIHCRRV